MNQFILDTSVAAAWYLPEVFAEPARVWQSSMLVLTAERSSTPWVKKLAKRVQTIGR